MTAGRIVLWLLLPGGLYAGGGSPIRQAPPAAANRLNPLQGGISARAGAKLFARECASCHGKNREGMGKAHSLNRPEVYRAAPGVLFWVLRNGALHRGMPSFAHLPEEERWQIVSFLQEVKEANPSVPG